MDSLKYITNEDNKRSTIVSHPNRTESKLCGLILAAHFRYAAAIQPQLGAYEYVVVQRHANTRKEGWQYQKFM